MIPNVPARLPASALRLVAIALLEPGLGFRITQSLHCGSCVGRVPEISCSCRIPGAAAESFQHTELEHSCCCFGCQVISAGSNSATYVSVIHDLHRGICGC